MKKRILYAFIGVCIITIILVLIIPGRKGEKAPSGSIDAFFHLYSAPADETLTVLLEEFESFYPEIDVEYTIKPYQDMRNALFRAIEELGGETAEDAAARAADTQTADTQATPDAPGRIIVTVLSGADLGRISDISDEEGIETDPVSGRENGHIAGRDSGLISGFVTDGFSPWIGDTWGLYFSRSRLEASGYTRDDLAELGAQGLDAFLAELAPVINEGEYLFYTGASYSWPWLAWIQHLELEASGGMAPGGYSQEAYSRGLDRWQNLIDRNLVNPDYADTGLAASFYAVREGKGLFVLSDSSIYGAYLPDERTDIEFIPFPGSQPGNWRVGSSFYLGAIYSEETPPEAVAAAAILRSYLRSEGIRERFLRKTGILLLSAASTDNLREISSLTQTVRDPELQELLPYLRSP